MGLLCGIESKADINFIFAEFYFGEIHSGAACFICYLTKKGRPYFLTAPSKMMWVVIRAMRDVNIVLEGKSIRYCVDLQKARAF